MSALSGGEAIGRRARVAVVLGVVGLIALTGCSAGTGASSENTATAPTANGLADTSGGAPATRATASDKGTTGFALPASYADRSIISKASLTVRVKDVRAAARDAATRAAGAGGFVAGEQTQAQPDHPESASAVLTLRIPANHLEQELTQLAGFGQLITQDQSAEDVTTQVVDVAARLKSEQASVARIRALLSKANTIGEIVAIEAELSQREAEVESLAAPSKALADQTSLATVTATFVGTANDTVPVTDANGFTGGLSRGWHAFTTSAAWVLTALGAVLPFAVLALLVGIPVRVLLRRRQRAVAA